MGSRVLLAPTLPAMSGGLGALSMAWISVEASMPLGWRLMALVRQPDSDIGKPLPPARSTARPCMAAPPKPERALRRLAEELRRI